MFTYSDPVPDPANPGHYKRFEDIYATPTSEKHRLLLSQGKGKLSDKEAGFHVGPERVRANVTCEECNKPR